MLDGLHNDDFVENVLKVNYLTGVVKYEPFIAGCTYGEQVCSHFRKGNNFLLASLDNGTFSNWVLL